MKLLLLKFFGIYGDSAGRIADVSPALRSSSNLGWVLLLMVVLGVGTIWIYRRISGLPTRQTRILMALRLTLFALLLLLLLRPVLQLTVQGSIRRTLVLLFDNSSSMKIEDARTEGIDRKRAAVVLNEDNLKSIQLDHPSRIDLVRGALTNDRLELTKKLGKLFDLRLYSFGQRLAELDSTAGAAGQRNVLNATSPVTPLGDSLREVLSRSRGQPLAGIVLVTDGQSNAGNSPIAAAEIASAQGVRLFTWGVGLPTARDVVVASVFAPDICFVNDEVPVVIRVRASGLAGQSGSLVVKLGADKIEEKTIAFDQDGEQVLSTQIKPQKAGEYEIEASIAPRADEIVKDNNRATQKIRVVDGKIKVLLVEQQARWEFKYLQALLMRDRRVTLKCYLAEADEGITKDDKGPFLERFPRTKEELLKYDLVILGDVDPNGLSQAQTGWIGEFVSKFGGGLLVISGKKYGPGAWANTPIGKMLPVEFDSMAKGGDVADKPLRLELTPAGERNSMLRLSDQPMESKRLWANLPPIYWDARVQRAKPAAEVLLVDADPAKAYRGTKMPVLAMQQYGLGQVLFSGTDNTWRWRKNTGDKYHAALWGQVVQRMSLPHLLGESKRTQLTSDRAHYSLGDRVTIYARLYDEAYQPVKDTVVRGVAKSGTSESEVMLRAMPDQPGMFRGEFVAPAIGSYQFALPSDPKSVLQIDVSEPRAETGESTMNESLLTEMANATGGQFLHEEDLPKLPEMVQAKTDLVKSKQEVELWASPFYFTLLVAVGGVEWALRKKWQLK